MNKVLFLVLLLSACASNDMTCPANVNSPNCGSHSYTTSEPVEVIYRNVTYTTVYEPKTYSTTKYVRRPYNKCDICH